MAGVALVRDVRAALPKFALPAFLVAQHGGSDAACVALDASASGFFLWCAILLECWSYSRSF